MLFRADFGVLLGWFNACFGASPVPRMTVTRSPQRDAGCRQVACAGSGLTSRALARTLPGAMAIITASARWTRVDILSLPRMLWLSKWKPSLICALSCSRSVQSKP